MEATGQDMSRVLHSEEALAVIGNYMGDKNLSKDVLGMLRDDATLIDRVRELPLHADNWMKKKNFVSLAREASAFPKETKTRIIHRRLGRLSEMGSYDKLRVEMTNDVFNDW